MADSRILRVGGSGGDAAIFEEAARILAGGGVVAHPTETLYGLAVNPWSPEGILKLSALKERDPSSGYIIIAAGLEQARRLVAPEDPAIFEVLAAGFWPGPLTLVLPPSREAPGAAAGARAGIALRVTSDPVAEGLVRAFGRPVTSTSANRSGKLPATTAAEVAAIFGAGVDLVIDGGARARGLPSTLLDLTSAEPVVIREGAVPASRILDAIGRSGARPG